MLLPTFDTQTRSSAAFTLIEMSIVLVIIGLLVGGVVVGRDLIEQAQLRSTVSQIQEYNLSANTFKIKYGNLPGDLNSKDCKRGRFC